VAAASSKHHQGKLCLLGFEAASVGLYVSQCKEDVDRAFSRPGWFGVAQLPKSVRYLDESHWSDQPD
jgi:hypothetical protein